jgi:hypothetical protein
VSLERGWAPNLLNTHVIACPALLWPQNARLKPCLLVNASTLRSTLQAWHVHPQGSVAGYLLVTTRQAWKANSQWRIAGHTMRTPCSVNVFASSFNPHMYAPHCDTRCSVYAATSHAAAAAVVAAHSSSHRGKMRQRQNDRAINVVQHTRPVAQCRVTPQCSCAMRTPSSNSSG